MSDEPIKIGGAVRDTLTVRFWRDEPGPNYKGAEPPDWCAECGKPWPEGTAGFGKTPLLALAALIETIGRDEGCLTDEGKLKLR